MNWATNLLNELTLRTLLACPDLTNCSKTVALMCGQWYPSGLKHFHVSTSQHEPPERQMSMTPHADVVCFCKVRLFFVYTFHHVSPYRLTTMTRLRWKGSKQRRNCYHSIFRLLTQPSRSRLALNVKDFATGFSAATSSRLTGVFIRTMRWLVVGNRLHFTLRGSDSHNYNLFHRIKRLIVWRNLTKILRLTPSKYELHCIGRRTFPEHSPLN